MADICNVCAESFNKTVRKPVECATCDFVACLACYKRYLCDNTADPCCMSCKKTWNYDNLVELFPKKFITTALKDHRRNQLFERELSLMPATQPFVEIEIERRRINAAINELSKESKRANLRYKELVMEHGNRRVPEKKEIKDRLAEISLQMMELNNQQFYQQYTKPEEKQVKVMRHCPAADCRGFLNTKWECGVCSVKACKECHEILDPNNGEHECKPEDVETAKLLMRDSKCCPGCAVMIFKISGCNQMWCSNCGTTFDWATLRVDRGNIHNPEYFRALHAGRLPFAQRENNNADVCGQNMPADYQVISHINSFRNELNAVKRQQLLEYYRKMVHLERVTRQRYTRNIIDENRGLRMSYMLKEITADAMKRRLQLREKSNNKCTAIVQVLDMVVSVATGMFHDMLQSRDANFIDGKAEEFKQLIYYGQECMEKVAITYDCEIPNLHAA